MDDFVPFGGIEYFALLGVLVFGRAMDFLSTWVATPHLLLEGNPVVRKLGWKWSLPLNVAVCGGFALWPLPAVALSTTSLLVAARNFQGAWLMRSMGEEAYRDWMSTRLSEVRLSLYLLCLFAQSALIAAVGGALMFFNLSNSSSFAIGLGIVSYALAVGFYSLLASRRLRLPWRH